MIPSADKKNKAWLMNETASDDDARSPRPPPLSFLAWGFQLPNPSVPVVGLNRRRRRATRKQENQTNLMSESVFSNYPMLYAAAQMSWKNLKCTISSYETTLSGSPFCVDRGISASFLLFVPFYGSNKLGGYVPQDCLFKDGSHKKS